MTSRTKRKDSWRMNTKIALPKKRNWYTNTRQRPSSSRSWKNSSSKSFRTLKRRKERLTRSLRKLCLRLVEAKEKDLGQPGAQHFRSYQELKVEECQGRLETKWESQMDFNRDLWEYLLSQLCEPHRGSAITDQALEIATVWQILLALLKILDPAMPLKV